MSKSRKTVWAAGGVVWRHAPDGPIEICVIHRPGHDDWTLPKGKAEAGETLITTSVREIEEETGQRVRLGRFLREVAYELPNSDHKRVRYWSAHALGGREFVANDEVDELRWVGLDEAREMLSYRLDRTILTEFTRLPVEAHTLLLVRHARAGRRSRYKGDDRKRPLDKLGREQAKELTGLLLDFGAQRVHAADRVRCEQTVAPLAAALDVPIEMEPQLSEEAYRADPDKAHKRILEIAADRSAIHAVCSQGKVIPPLMSWWADADGITLPAKRNRKGSVWVLSLVDGRLIAADHVDSPLPRVDHG
ncbi:NUDIX hydrolase [Gordonia sp. CPCC 205515]|uniref:NUDIX hydrolase n=1 Tax=Gordonia sp. CPCC 205515 TaxID=3140791 RepID=UPI003AF384BE